MEPENDIDQTEAGGALPGLSAAEAFQAYQRQQALVEKQIKDNMARIQAGTERLRAMRVGPSEAERLAAISAALLRPRTTNTFAEAVSNVGRTLAEQEKLKRTAEMEREDLLEKYGMQMGNEQLRLLQQGLTGAGQVYRSAQAAETAAKKAMRPIFRGTETLANGEIVAVYEDPPSGELTKKPVGVGMQQMVPVANVTSGGQPVFRMGDKTVLANGMPVTQFDKPPRKLSPTEQKQIFDVEDVITSGKGAISAMQQALQLNDQAYEGSLSGARKMLGQLFASDDPTYVATESLDNLITKSALESLRATFGGNPTEGERKILLDLQASSNKPKAVRQEIYQRAVQMAQLRIERESKRLTALKGGEYGVVAGSGSTAGAKRLKYNPKTGVIE